MKTRYFSPSWRTAKLALSAVPGVCLFLFLLTIRPALAQTAYGSLSNFDAMNDTGQPCHGFEIELDDTTSKDITYTFDYQRYGTPKIVDSVSSDGLNKPAVYVRWQSPYDPVTKTFTQATPVAVNPSVDTGGHLCFPGNTVNSLAYEQSGCEHFGIGTLNNPSKTVYRWMVEDPATPGSLKPLGTSVSIPAPIWIVIPNPVNPAVNPPVVQAVLAPPPAVVIPAKEFGDAMWVKVFKTETPKQADLNHLVTDDPAVPQDAAETEIEWKIWQPCNPAVVANCQDELINEGQVGNGNESVTRRYEFYKYVGTYDPETHEATLNPKTCQDAPFACDANGKFDPTQPTGDLGDYIGAQMAAVNIAQALAVINKEQPQGEAQIKYPDRPLVIGGSGVYSVTPSSGTIPPGLSIDPVTGILSGTPTQAGDYLFTVQATDIDAGGSISGDFHIVIAPAVAITTATLPEGVIGQAYNTTIGMSGGVAPYQWTVTGVGGGLSVVDNVLSGTPTTAGTYNVTATVTDQFGGSATKPFTLVIHCPAPVTTATFSCQTVTLNATDQGCGLTTSYSVDGGATQNYAGPFTLAGGAHVVTYWSADATGTKEANHTVQVPAPTPAPTLTSLNPNTATAGSAVLPLTVTGTGFEANSVVQWNGALRLTTFISASQLTVSIPATDLTTTGTAQVSVATISACGGGTSAALPFTITSPTGGGGNHVEAEAQGTPVSPQVSTGTFTLFPLTETVGFFSEGKPLSVVTTAKTVFLDTKEKVITKAQFFTLLAQVKKVEVEGTFAKVPSAGGVLVNTITAKQAKLRK